MRMSRLLQIALIGLILSGPWGIAEAQMRGRGADRYHEPSRELPGSMELPSTSLEALEPLPQHDQNELKIPPHLDAGPRQNENASALLDWRQRMQPPPR